MKASQYHPDCEKQCTFNYEWLSYMGKNYHKFILTSTVLSTVRYCHINAATNIMKGIKYDSIQSLGGHLYAETLSVQSIC